jgi:hypothetical protein
MVSPAPRKWEELGIETSGSLEWNEVVTVPTITVSTLIPIGASSSLSVSEIVVMADLEDV